MLALLKENDIECLEGIHDTAVSSDPTFAAQYPHPYSATTAAAAAIKLSSSSSSSSKLIGLPFDKKLCLNKCFKCPECNKCFSQLGNLRTHQNIHSLVKPFQCKVCQRNFAQQSTLLQHMRLHTGEKPYKCRICNKDFTQSSHLQQHLRTHTGERPYKCSFCDKDFAQRSTLNQHTLTHTGLKLFICPHCSKSFAQASHLNQHVRRHTGEKPYKCCICRKEFAQSSNLVQHTRTHTGEKPYHCSQCNRQFSQCSHLNQHVRNKHDYKSPVGINDNTNNNINSNNNQYLLTKYQRIQENSTMRDSTLIPSSVSGCQPTLFTPFNHKTFTISSALTTHKNKHNLSFIGPTSDSPLLNSHSLTHDGYKEQLTLVPTSQVSQSNYDADQNNQITFPPEEWVPNYGQLSQNFLQNLQDSHIKTSDISHGRIFHLNWNNQDNISKILHES